ncbi:hypothetical protein DSO57_1025300 [Entomophthora muscae]|uniref:Uncharacterized protein n=1 Tax=Entomophthora muscae TaxID=34485 RepID=A0ACC2RH36_9FUNG|nr:hypothetical protein DSO57_1025300 [Entomophthora muscae]
MDQERKNPRISLRKSVVISTKKEREKPTGCQESMGSIIQDAKKEVPAFKKLVDRRASKKHIEALNPSTVKPIPEDTNMG